jgi:outer membrane protein, multidrug efflux system
MPAKVPATAAVILGLSDFLEVLDAERTMLDAQNQLAGGRTDATTAYVAVYKALGGTLPLGEAAQ